MTAADKVQASNVWDARYGLPTIPINNNPWIYTAYVFALVKIVDGLVPPSWWEALLKHVQACMTPEGILRRWPDGGGLSHDELIGAAHLSPVAAKSIIVRLEEQDGLYSDPNAEQEYFFRFAFLMPYLRARAGFRVGLVSQIVFSFCILLHGWSYGPTSGDSDTLKFWLMGIEMEKVGLCALAVPAWRKTMAKKGRSLKSIFSTTYLTECPVLGEIAPETL